MFYFRNRSLTNQNRVASPFFRLLLLSLATCGCCQLSAQQAVKPFLPDVSFEKSKAKPIQQLNNSVNSDPVDGTEILVRVADSSTDLLIEVANFSWNGTQPLDAPNLARTFVPESAAVNDWIQRFLSKDSPSSVAVRDRWQKRVELSAKTRYSLAIEGGTDAALKTFIQRYLHSQEGEAALMELAGRAVRRGNIQAAIEHLKMLDPSVASFGGEQLDSHLSRSKMPAAEIGARLVLLDSIDKPSNATANFQWFVETYPDASGTLGQRTGELASMLTEELSKLELANDAVGIEEPLPPVLESSWSINISVQPKDELSRPTISQPVFLGGIGEAGDWVTWSNASAIQAVKVSDGTPAFSSDGSFDVWKTKYPNQKTQRPASQLADFCVTEFNGKPAVFAFSNSESELIGLDFSQQGRLLPGFPQPNLISQRNLAEAPIVHNGRLYVALLVDEIGQKSQVGSDATLLVSCFELKTIDDGSGLNPLWTKSLFRTQLQSPNQPTVGLKIVGDQLLVNSHCGAVAALNVETRQIDWLLTYPRSNWQDPYSDAGRFRAARLAQPPFVHGQTLYVLPADSHSLLAIDQRSGKALWQLPIPAAQEVLHVSEQSILLGGPQLVWLKRKGAGQRPQILDRYPNEFVNSSGRLRQPTSQLTGPVVADESFVWLASGEQILRLPRESKQAGFVSQQLRAVWRSEQPNRLNAELIKNGRQEVRHVGHLIKRNDMMIYFDGQFLHGIKVRVPIK